MGSSLWKLGALLGVIGAGFLVLLQAQKSMTNGEAPKEEFDEVAAIDELQNSDEATDRPFSTAQLARADTDLPESASHLDETPPQVEPTPAEVFETDPTTEAAPAGGETPHAVNPFAAFAGELASDAPSAETSNAEDSADESESNPFADLVRSLADDATTDTEQEPEVATTEAADEFDPFATGAEQPPEMQPNQAVGAAVGIVFESEPPRTESASNPVLPDPEAAEIAGSDADTADRETPQRFELTPLAADDPGPALIAPPTEGSPDSARAPQQAEPAVYEFADDDSSEDTGEVITQVGAEERPRSTTDPNPFLVFPGSDPAQNNSPAESSRMADSALPSIEPRGFTGGARENNRSAATESRVVLPDGTIEMTIKPRGQGSSTNIAATEPQPRAQSPENVNPFATVPELPRERPAMPTSTAATVPTFPGDGSSSGSGTVRPAGAEFPASNPPQDGPLTSADFVGVGTITPDTPSTPQQAQLTIEKQAPDDAVLGQDLIYSILVRNIGRSPAKNVVVEDLVPKGSELKGTDPQAQMTQDKKLLWKLGTMDPGARQMIRSKDVPTGTGQIGSVATVSFEAAVASRTVITAPELRLAMNGPNEVRVGEKAPYKFTLTNTGSADATNVFIRSIIPAGFEHPAATQENGVTDIEYEVGRLPRGGSKEIELTLLAVAPGEFQPQAILTADGNVSVESRQQVNIIKSRLQIHRNGPANRFVGSEARFLNTVSNASSQPLHNVTVTESIPAGAEFVGASDGGHYNPQQRTVSWRIDTLEPGGARQLQSSIRATQSGQLASSVRAIDQRGENAEVASQLTVAGFSSLTVDVANPGRPIPVGEEVALRLKVRNGGTAAANAVETRVQIPPELRFVSAKGPVRYAQQGEWIAFEPISRIDTQGEQIFDIVLAAAEASDDARVVVQLSSNELSRPLSEDESVVIYADNQ